LLDIFVGNPDPKDTFMPEDWISSFVEAKNRVYIEGEGISKVLVDGRELPINEIITEEDLGPGRRDSGVLVKYLNSAERLGIQVHPTPEFSKKHFGTNYGKTECWHILDTEGDACIYIGFKEGMTRERWKDLFLRQDIDGMLESMHRFSVKKGDTVLVRAGTPHAIGAGCFLLEIQEPSDYTMRVERVTVAGEKLTPMQIHYGVGEEAMLDCFIYGGMSEEAARQSYFIASKPCGEGRVALVSYEDTHCFALERLGVGGCVSTHSFVSLVVTVEGDIDIGQQTLRVKRGEKWFVPYGCGDIRVGRGEVIVCYPPKL